MPKLPAKPERKVREADVQDAIRLALGRDPRVVLWRNNVGAVSQVSDDGETRWIKYGVGGDGGSDLIGICAGRFFALEVKSRTGRYSDAQLTFMALVRAKGGFACGVRSVEDALAAVARCLSGASK